MGIERDSNGKTVEAGDTIHFSYGIPPVGVDAKLVERDGRLIAVCPPPHKPTETTLKNLLRHVGYFYKVEPRKAKPKEVEARIFAALKSGAPDA